MTRAKRYLLDADTFIQAKNRHYAFDICPGYWTALLRLNKVQRVFSITSVREELIDYKDALSDWVKNETPATFFKQIDDRRVSDEYKKIAKWLQAQDQYSEDAKAKFLAGADPWIIAYAKANNYTVVTYEVHRPNSKNKVPIPNVCRTFKVDYADPFDMLRQLKVRFRAARGKSK